MAHVGRGRSRGGRILEVSESGPGRGMGHGRVMVGRGISVIRPLKLKEDPAVHLDPTRQNSSDHVNKGALKKTLQDQLMEFQRTKTGSFIHITLDYFSTSDDVKYYIDKIMDCVLSCSCMVQKFTMDFRLITLLKTFGAQIKLTMFSKLQATFQEMLILMEDSHSLSTVEKESVLNLCDLLGQLYFRFRLQLDSLERYNVLAEPALRCMSHLLKVRDKQHLLVLLKLIAYNYSALCDVNPEKMDDFSIDIRSEIVADTEDNLERILLMCALDLTLNRISELAPLITEFYMNEIGPILWHKTVPSSPTQMVTSIPEDIVERIDEFDVTVDEYDLHKFVVL